MANIKFDKLLLKAIKDDYKNYDYTSLEEFKESVLNDEPNALLILYCIVSKNSKSKTLYKMIVEEGVRLHEFWAIDIMFDNYHFGFHGYEQDLNKGIELYKNELGTSNDKEAKFALGEIYYALFKTDEKKEEGLKLIHEVAESNGEESLYAANWYFNQGMYDEAIKYYKRYRPSDGFKEEDLDEEGVLYQVYPYLIEVYEKLYDEDAIDRCVKVGYEHNIPHCMLIMALYKIFEKDYVGAFKIYQKTLPLSPSETFYSLYNFFQEEKNPMYDLELSKKCFKEGSKLYNHDLDFILNIKTDA